MRGIGVILGLSLALAACGGGGRDRGPATESSGTPARVARSEAGLTSKLPETVLHACQKLTKTYRRTVYCPPLVPDGKASRQYVGGKNRRPGDAARSYVLDFNSSVLNHIGGARVEANGGHWVVEAGRAEDVGDDVGLYIPRRQRRGRVKSSPARIDGQRVRIYRSACCFEAYLAGHYSVVWRRHGVSYAVSIHGYRNRPRVLAMARALIRLQQACDRASMGTSCALAMPGQS